MKETRRLRARQRVTAASPPRPGTLNRLSQLRMSRSSYEELFGKQPSVDALDSIRLVTVTVIAHRHTSWHRRAGPEAHWQSSLLHSYAARVRCDLGRRARHHTSPADCDLKW